MCVSCVSRVEALAVSSTGAAALLAAGVSRVRAMVSGTWRSRQQAAWEANARFIESLGLEPAAVLGPPPGEVRAQAEAPPPRWDSHPVGPADEPARPEPVPSLAR